MHNVIQPLYGLSAVFFGLSLRNYYYCERKLILLRNSSGKNLPRSGVLCSSRVIGLPNGPNSPIWNCGSLPLGGNKLKRKAVITASANNLFTTPSLNPYLNLPPEHNIVRQGRKKEWVLLENDGILQVSVQFNIADRKKLGINNKVRKLTLDYKVVSNNFKTVLNDYINNDFSTPIGPPYFAAVKGVTQTFTGTYNGLKLTVPINATEFGGNFTLEKENNTNVNNYLKIITYKFHQAWLNAIRQPGFVFSEPRQNIGTAPVTSNAVNFNINNPEQSSGLFLFKNTSSLFDISPVASNEPIVRDIVGEIDLEGRVDPPSELEIQSDASLITANEGNSFTYFTKLPVAFTILERRQFSLTSIPSTGLLQSIANSVREALRAARNTLTGTQPSADLVTGDAVFVLDPALFPVAISNPLENEKIEKHELILIERKTDFFMDQYESIDNVASSPFVFSYFENNARYERCYVDASLLAANLHVVLLQHVRKAHSMRIVYNNIQFMSFAQKLWYNTEESFCKKIPLKNISSKQVAFNALVSGQHPGEDVNTNANLMFTAQFNRNQGVFYKTNRFITCSSFSTQTDIQDPAVRNLWLDLERGFGSSVVLSTYPLVGLIPCFSRGEIIQTTDTVLFKGLVSNSGGDEGF